MKGADPIEWPEILIAVRGGRSKPRKRIVQKDLGCMITVLQSVYGLRVVPLNWLG